MVKAKRASWYFLDRWFLRWHLSKYHWVTLSPRNCLSVMEERWFTELPWYFSSTLGPGLTRSCRGEVYELYVWEHFIEPELLNFAIMRFIALIDLSTIHTMPQVDFPSWWTPQILCCSSEETGWCLPAAMLYYIASQIVKIN